MFNLKLLHIFVGAVVVVDVIVAVVVVATTEQATVQ